MTGLAAVPKFTAAAEAHWLHSQTTARVPRNYVFFDTEAHREMVGTHERQTWRLGVTCVVRWDQHRHAWAPPVVTRHPTADHLWQTVTAAAPRSSRTVVVAHNLAYDLRISNAMELLPAFGWSIEKPTFQGQYVGLEAVRAESHLVMVDSVSVLPQSVKTLGTWLGIDKPELPAEDDSAEAWWARCEADVEILRSAYMTVVDWLDGDELGGWGRSGASMGWHVMLKSHLADKVLVHGQANVREAEAAAMYAGRAEAWRHGLLAKGPYHEWDFALAYANVCAEEPLPAVLLGEVRGKSLRAMQDEAPGLAYLVEAQISTPVPVLPWSDNGGVFWPIGTFTGWWWAFELANAVAAGATVRPVRAWKYRASPWLASFSRWCIDQVADLSTPTARIRGCAAKHWTRSVPGRTAMRYKAWEDMGRAYVPGMNYEPALDIDSGARGAILTLGDRRWEAWASEWGDSALPQVLSTVMAHCRVRLWKALQCAGFEHLVYCDTDSLIVDVVGHERLSEAVADGALWSLRHKGEHEAIEVIGPQQVEATGYRRHAGIPRNAQQTGRLSYEAERWEGITTSLARGRAGEVWVHPIRAVLTGVDTRRLHLPGGMTAAFQVENGERVMGGRVA